MSFEPTTKHVPALVARIIANSRLRGELQAEKAGEIAAAQKALLDQAATARTANAARHLEACGVDPLTRAPFAAGRRLEDTHALEGARAWIRNGTYKSRPFLVLCTSGGYGAGKSVAAAYCLLRATRTARSLAHELADEPTTFEEYDSSKGLWIRAASVRSSSRFLPGREVPLMDLAATVRWLVLDEVRTADVQGAGQARIEELLSERYARGLPTVITSNLGQDDLSRCLGPRLASRIHEGGVIVDPGQVDLRRREQK